jgi:hypothetical protein
LRRNASLAPIFRAQHRSFALQQVCIHLQLRDASAAVGALRQLGLDLLQVWLEVGWKNARFHLGNHKKYPH